MNPAVDVSTSVERIEPESKMRCEGLYREPGGGGINVARVVGRMGAPAQAIYTRGGVIGHLLSELVEREGLRRLELEIAGQTREDFTVLERATGNQLRFVLAGPHVTVSEWQACLDRIRTLAPFPEYLVASGSLPPGVPDDFYGRVAKLVAERGSKIVLDTSGPALGQVLTGNVFLIKPNLDELSDLVGHCLATDDDAIRACRSLVAEGHVDVIALTLGNRGALLATANAIWRAPAVPVTPLSAVGAGDSFLGAMVWGLAAGHALESAFRYAMSAGSAALLTPGTELCRADDVHRLLDAVTVQRIE